MFIKPKKPEIKYNGGVGAILCKKCRGVIKTHLSFSEFNGDSPLYFCKECTKKIEEKMKDRA